MFPLPLVAFMFLSMATAEDSKSDSKTTPPVKSTKRDPNTNIFPAGSVTGTVVKVTDDQIILKVNETVNTPGPSRRVNVGGRTVSVPTTKTKTVQKDETYSLESDAKLKVINKTKNSDAPSSISDLKAGMTVLAYLNKHVHANINGGKPDISFFVREVDFTPQAAPATPATPSTSKK
ncbi:hypothetical protein [Zavarzinella formosa]|uniref:hypothetical protein n=1 Tax=Zavarzinella formosa TaxID=360055 RepID=UPI0012F9F93D|nr:hypothetical protein [Zavarzinella formosa]